MTSDLLPKVLISALALVAAALVAAGLYALLGKPATHAAKERRQHIVNGFAIGGGILLGMILMGSVVFCSQITFGIVQSTRISKDAALFVAIVSIILIFSMIEHWAKRFAGWIGYSVLNGLMMVSSGHLVNNPNIHVPRWWSISATALAFVTALVCLRFAKAHRLNAADKAALMCWVLAFTFAVDVDSTRLPYHQQLGLIAMCVGCSALVAAWWYEHRRNSRNRHLRKATHPAVTA
jgi:hypothetical protein